MPMVKNSKSAMKPGRVAVIAMALDALLSVALLLLGFYMLYTALSGSLHGIALPALLFIAIGGVRLGKLSPMLLASMNSMQAEGVLHKSIIVPVSRPETVESLVNIACDLLAEGGTLRLLSIIEVPRQLPYDYADTRKEKARELLTKAAGFCQKRGVTPKLEIVSARSIPEAILDLANSYKADLVVMGSSQRSVPEKVLFGNVVDPVLRMAPCEVVIFSYSKALQPIRYDKILVPTSGYKHARRALDIAIHFQKMSRGAATAMFVGTDADAEKGKVILTNARLHAERLGADVETLFKAGNVVDSVVSTAKDGGYTLIIIGSTERPSYYTFLLGSTADEIVTKAPCNVLVVRTKK